MERARSQHSGWLLVSHRLSDDVKVCGHSISMCPMVEEAQVSLCNTADVYKLSTSYRVSPTAHRYTQDKKADHQEQEGAGSEKPEPTSGRVTERCLSRVLNSPSSCISAPWCSERIARGTPWWISPSSSHMLIKAGQHQNMPTLLVLGVEPRPLYTLSTYSSIEPHLCMGTH